MKTRWFIIITVIFTFAFHSSIAAEKENKDEAPIRWGLKGGASVAWMSFSGNSEDVDPRYGVGFGFYRQKQFDSPRTSARLEMMWLMKGCDKTYYPDTGGWTVDYRVSSIVFAPFLVHHLSKEPDAKFFVEGGMDIGVLFWHAKGGSNWASGYSGFEFSLNLGCGYKLNDTYHVDLRYSMGLSDLSSGGSDLRNHGVQLMLGKLY